MRDAGSYGCFLRALGVRWHAVNGSAPSDRLGRTRAADGLDVRRLRQEGVAMLEILLYCVTAAAVVRCSWLVVGLVRVIPVHLRARTRKWGGAEVFTFLELPVFLALTALLVGRAFPPPPGNPTSLALAAVGTLLALAGVASMPLKPRTSAARAGWPGTNGGRLDARPQLSGHRLDGTRK